MPQQMAQECHDLVAADRARKQPEAEVPPGAPCRRRERLSIEVILQRWGQVPEHPYATPTGAFAQPALVDEKGGLPLLPGFRELGLLEHSSVQIRTFHPHDLQVAHSMLEPPFIIDLFPQVWRPILVNDLPECALRYVQVV